MTTINKYTSLPGLIDRAFRAARNNRDAWFVFSPMRHRNLIDDMLRNEARVGRSVHAPGFPMLDSMPGPEPLSLVYVGANYDGSFSDLVAEFPDLNIPDSCVVVIECADGKTDREQIASTNDVIGASGDAIAFKVAAYRPVTDHKNGDYVKPFSAPTDTEQRNDE